jgi:signal transduction histidine kinase
VSEANERVRWRHRLSLRLRITLLTALVVALVVTGGGLLILVALRSELVGIADEAGRIRAEEVTELASQDALPTPLPVMQDPETFVEVVSDGQLVTATEGLDESNLFDLPERDGGDKTVSEVGSLPLGHRGPYRVTAHGVDTPSGPMTVFSAVSIADLEGTMDVTTEIGTIGVIVLVVVLATLTWLAIGHALAPVEAIRARADAITGHNLGSRVPVTPHQDEIGRLARTVNRMLGRLQDSAEQQQRFVADAAHELRSPIASLRVQLETAQDGSGLRGREGDLLVETVRMENMVDQLLLLARADVDTPWLRRSTVDLDDVVDSAVISLDGVAAVAIDTSGVEPVQVSGDADLLVQVVRNLVQNALRYARGTVRISVSSPGGSVAVVTVDDDGHGVPADQRDHIFGRFVRLEDSRDRDQGGVGLGLAIVAEIVRAHGGRIGVSDAPIGGARFVVELPLESDRAV